MGNAGVMQQNKRCVACWGVLWLNAALFIVWPLAHTIALRKLLLVLAAMAGIALLIQSASRREILRQPWLILMGMLLAWVVLHAAFISQNGAEAWREFLGQWVPPYVALFAGIGLALAGSRLEEKKFSNLLLVTALALPVFYVMANLVKWVQIGYLPIGYLKPGEPNFVLAGTDLKTSLTFSLEMLVPFTCVRLLDFWKQTGRFSLKTSWMLLLLLAVAVAMISLIKNFILLLVLNVTLTLLLLGLRSGIFNMRRLLTGIAGLGLLGVIVVSNSTIIHQYWQRAVSNTSIALNIDQYQNWKNFTKRGLPQNEFGETLSETYYLRLAYAHAGFRDMLEAPWGYGITREAMERIEQQKDPEVSLAHAHNGYLNMACAVGLPGLVLFAMAMTAVILQLKQSLSRWAMPAIWMIGFYLLHWAVDAIERDHYFEMFMFVIGLMTTLTLMDNKRHG